MTPENFCYWLNGYVDLVGYAPTEAQWECIKDHLILVFKQEVKPVSPTVIEEYKEFDGEISVRQNLNTSPNFKEIRTVPEHIRIAHKIMC